MHYRFLWDKKPSKISWKTLIMNYNEGGIKLIDIEKFTYSLKASWIKRLFYSQNNTVLKQFYNKQIIKYGENLLFESYLTKSDINKMFPKENSLKDIIFSWMKIKETEKKYAYWKRINLEQFSLTNR